MNKEIKEKTRFFLREMGVPTHLLGYRYLEVAIPRCLEYPEEKYNVTTMLYPGVALEVNSTGSRVERAIRHAVEVAFLRIDPTTIEHYFGNTIDPMKGKPTNSEFLAGASQWVEEQLED